MSIAEQIGFIDELIQETEGVRFRTYGTRQRLKALRAIRATLMAELNRPVKQEGLSSHKGDEA